MRGRDSKDAKDTKEINVNKEILLVVDAVANEKGVGK